MSDLWETDALTKAVEQSTTTTADTNVPSSIIIATSSSSDTNDSPPNDRSSSIWSLPAVLPLIRQQIKDVPSRASFFVTFISRFNSSSSSISSSITEMITEERFIAELHVTRTWFNDFVDCRPFLSNISPSPFSIITLYGTFYELMERLTNWAHHVDTVYHRLHDYIHHQMDHIAIRYCAPPVVPMPLSSPRSNGLSDSTEIKRSIHEPGSLHHQQSGIWPGDWKSVDDHIMAPPPPSITIKGKEDHPPSVSSVSISDQPKTTATTAAAHENGWTSLSSPLHMNRSYFLLSSHDDVVSLCDTRHIIERPSLTATVAPYYARAAMKVVMTSLSKEPSFSTSSSASPLLSTVRPLVVDVGSGLNLSGYASSLATDLGSCGGHVVAIDKWAFVPRYIIDLQMMVPISLFKDASTIPSHDTDAEDDEHAPRVTINCCCIVDTSVFDDSLDHFKSLPPDDHRIRSVLVHPSSPLSHDSPSIGVHPLPTHSHIVTVSPTRYGIMSNEESMARVTIRGWSRVPLIWSTASSLPVSSSSVSSSEPLTRTIQTTPSLSLTLSCLDGTELWRVLSPSSVHVFTAFGVELSPRVLQSMRVCSIKDHTLLVTYMRSASPSWLTSLGVYGWHHLSNHDDDVKMIHHLISGSNDGHGIGEYDRDSYIICRRQ
jgi:hypothetical protein